VAELEPEAVAANSFSRVQTRTRTEPLDSTKSGPGILAKNRVKVFHRQSKTRPQAGDLADRQQIVRFREN
jgi:hypothetical protein